VPDSVQKGGKATKIFKSDKNLCCWTLPKEPKRQKSLPKRQKSYERKPLLKGESDKNLLFNTAISPCGRPKRQISLRSRPATAFKKAKATNFLYVKSLQGRRSAPKGGQSDKNLIANCQSDKNLCQSDKNLFRRDLRKWPKRQISSHEMIFTRFREPGAAREYSNPGKAFRRRWIPGEPRCGAAQP
jgi:hypothetical protein